jgi:Uma2 family endonuclease
MVPSPGIAHQRVSGRLYAQLAAALDGCPDCEVLFEIDVELAHDTIVRPDVIVICHRPEGDRITRPPELIAEVVSPSTRRRDEQTKFELYRQEGVTWYLLLDPAAAKARLYRLVDGDYREVDDGNYNIPLSACRIVLDCSQLWAKR